MNLIETNLTPRERVLTALRLEKPDRIPWVELYVHRQLAEDILEKPVQVPHNLRTPPEVLKVLNLDNLTYNLKPPEFAEKHSKGGMKFIGKGLIKTRDDLDIMKQLPNPGNESIYEPLQKCIERYRKDYAFIVQTRFGIANTYLSMGIDNFSIALYQDPEFVSIVMDTFIDWTKEVVKHIQNLDIDILVFSDDLAGKSGPLFSPKMVREMFIPRMEKIAKLIELPWIYHSDGNYLPLLNDLLTLDMDGIANLEPGAMNLAQLKKDYGDRVCLMGNIDLHYTLTRGTVEETEKEVKTRIREAGSKGGYIIASSNGLTSYCKKENILAMNSIVEKSFYPL